MEFILTTARLALRRFPPADLDHLVDLTNDPAVMRYINGGRPTPRHVIAHELLSRYLRDYDMLAGYGRWAAIEKASGDFIGWFSLRPWDGGSHFEAELGYRLCRSGWGRGYAS